TGSLMRPTPDADPRLDEAPPRWLPRAVPPPATLVAGELFHRVVEPAVAAASLRALARDPGRTVGTVIDSALAVREAIAAGAPATPLNVDIGPHRRFDWTVMDLARTKAIGHRLGAKLNDVVLAIVTGALRRFLHRREVAVERLDFRAMVPVNARPSGEHDALG